MRAFIFFAFLLLSFVFSGCAATQTPTARNAFSPTTYNFSEAGVGATQTLV